MPAGTTPTGTPVPASSAHTVRTVPSPPQTSTRSAPEIAACSAIERPGSSIVVSYQVGAPQPVSSAIRSTMAWKTGTLSTLTGFSTTASCRVLGSGEVLRCSTGRERGAGW